MDFTIDFKPGVSETFSVPEKNVLFNAVPRKTAATGGGDSLIAASLDHPIGSLRLAELLKPEMHVVVLVDDITRPTPTRPATRTIRAFRVRFTFSSP